MSIFNRIRTFSFTALVAALVVAPGCDDGSDYEALGVAAHELDAMSDEELEALELDLVALDEDLPCDTHGPVEGEFVAAEDGEFERPGMIHDDLAIELQFTHSERPGVDGAPREAVQPIHPTHGDRPGVVGAPREVVQPIHPTHGDRPLLANTDEFGAVPEPIEPCDLPRDFKMTAK